MSMARRGSIPWCVIVSGALMIGAIPVDAQGTVAFGGQKTETHETRQRNTISIEFTNVSLSRAINEIARKAGIRIGYSEALLPPDKRVTLRAAEITVRDALEQILRGTSLTVASYGGQLAIVERESKQTKQEKGSLIGKVIDSASEQGLNGVTVTVSGTKLSATTDAKGHFIIRDVPRGAYSITFRMLGYTSVTRTVNIADGKPMTINITLKAAATTLSGVVTTATGVKQRIEVGHTVTVLDVDEIRKTAPITSVTDLLVTRVPGMASIRSTGAPGDPTRLRLRGTNSILLNNDPIVIVDGMRIYAEQTGERNANLASVIAQGGAGPKLGNQDGSSPSGLIPVTSPLDRIDPNSIDKIEVLNGPSASAIYGSDAANGVIVITTKRGKPGPTRWTFDGTFGTTRMPGTYPTRYLRWGKEARGGKEIVCPISYYTCEGEDSVIAFNSMNDPSLTPLGHGGTHGVSTSVSGGTATIRYALTGSLFQDIGYLKLPTAAVEDYRRIKGSSPAGWMRRPNSSTRKNGSASLTLLPTQTTTIIYSTILSRSGQTRTGLENAVTEVDRTYREQTAYGTTRYMTVRSNGAGIWLNSSNFYLNDVYRQITSDGNDQRHSLQATWNAWPWLTLFGSAGLDDQSRNDQSYLAAGLPTFIGTYDSLGQYQVGQAATTTGTLIGRVTAHLPQVKGIKMTPTVGFEYNEENQSLMMTEARELMRGRKTLTDAKNLIARSETANRGTFGTFIEPGLNFWDRYYFSPAIRFDGGTTFGGNVKGYALPKLSLSWVASNEPFLRLPGFVEMLRFRTAFGQSGKQPMPLGKLRLYRSQMKWIDGRQVEVATVASYGNTRIRPERSIEWEGGFDTDLYEGRLSFGVTLSHKVTRDMLIDLPVAPSVYAGMPSQNSGLLFNIGRVRNTNTEFTAMLVPVRSPALTWTIQANYTISDNVLQRVARTAQGLLPGVHSWTTGRRYVEGYSLDGLWARPVVAYADADGNGIIDESEVQVADSSTYLGSQMPRYVGGLHSGISLWNGRFNINMTFSYQDGAAQVNHELVNNRWFTKTMTNASSPLAAQAALVSMSQTSYSAAQVFSIWRFNDLSVSYLLPTSITRSLRMSMASISLQGQNLGISTNYNGIDPNTNILSTVETSGIADAGMPPQARLWQLKLSLTR